MNSEYFWWLAALAFVAAGGIVAVLSWRPAPDDEPDDLPAEVDASSRVLLASPADTDPEGPATAIR